MGGTQQIATRAIFLGQGRALPVLSLPRLRRLRRCEGKALPVGFDQLAQFVLGDRAGVEHGGQVPAKFRLRDLAAQVHLQPFLHHATQHFDGDERSHAFPFIS